MKLTIEGMTADELLIVLKGLHIREAQLRNASEYNNKAVIDTAFDIVKAETKIEKGAIKSTLREAHIVRARFMVARLLKEFSRMTLREIGNEIGGRDHSSVIHAVETHKGDCEFDKDAMKQWLRVYSAMEDAIVNNETIKEITIQHLNQTS